MKKLKKILLIILLLVPLVGCQNQKNEWKETYQLTYFYLKDCSNCQHFKKNVLPAIKKEFGIEVDRKKIITNFCEEFEKTLIRRIKK